MNEAQDNKAEINTDDSENKRKPVDENEVKDNDNHDNDGLIEFVPSF